MLFREDKVARADAEAIRKGVGFYRWTHDLVEITGKDRAGGPAKNLYQRHFQGRGRAARNTPLRWTKTVKSSTT